MDTLDFGKKKRRVPVLRFGEFKGEWEDFKIGDITNKVGSGSTPSGGNQVYQNQGVPFIRSQNVTGNKLILDNTHISEEINLKMKGSIVKPDDILLNITGGSIGRSCVVPSEFDRGNVNQHVCIIRLKSDFEPRFVQPFLSSHKGQKLIYQGQTGSGREGLNFQSIRLFKLKSPSLPEQKKIATFLSTIDKKIQQLSRKKELLEQYKKGVMQQLFPSKAGQVPELRFQDEEGKEYPDWEEKRLGDVCEMTSSKRVYLSDYVDKGIPFYRGKEISELRLNLTPSDILYISNERYEEFKSKYGVPIKNDILITAVGTLGNVLRIRNNDAFYFKDGNLIWLKKIVESPYFLEILLQWKTRKILKTSIGSTQKALTMVELKKITFSFPSKKEQQKIANYLSQLDKKIATLNNKITQTQSFKKGLLQQMFV